MWLIDIWQTMFVQCKYNFQPCQIQRLESRYTDLTKIPGWQAQTAYSGLYIIQSIFCMMLPISWYSTLTISCTHFSPSNSWKTPMTHPLGRDMGVFCEFNVWPKFRIRRCCTVCNIMLYCTVIYQESIVMTGTECRSDYELTKILINLPSWASYGGSGHEYCGVNTVRPVHWNGTASMWYNWSTIMLN